uniref:Spermidine/putrescine ABC transporter permease n=1 Tax=Clostridioides difficile TaxID=1496 RepID=A0A381I834_CLODI|nr:spermidine/putrescine ABC transporter permease [Clostridioides difficile]
MKRKSFLAYPYVVWSAIFVIIPLILVVFFSFTKESGGGYAFTLENYKEVIDPIYMKVFGRSILLAGGATLICLIVGYPVAYIISKARVSRRGSLILLFILPMWMNFLLRNICMGCYIRKKWTFKYIFRLVWNTTISNFVY